MEMLVALIAGVMLGVAGAWLLSRERSGAVGASVRAELQPRIASLEAGLSASKEQAADLKEELAAIVRDRDRLRGERERLATEKAQLETRLEQEKAGFSEKLDLLGAAKDALSDQFRVLANTIFEEKSSKFTQQNQEQLTTLLGPLGEKIRDFETRIQTVYDNETQQRTALKTEIAKLVEANEKISSDTTNLARALKGDSKTQGAWGEMILERALEMAGLTRDREYRIQQHYLDQEGGRLRPDVIIDLPEGRHMVIDSKVSLTSYERLCASMNEHEKARELSMHVASMRNHMVSLGKKDYQKLHGLETLDFVIMFVPIESAYSVAVQADPLLTQDALEKNVLIVYPSTLLMALRTIAHVWRYEYQNRNAQEIARQAGALYDKFVGFMEDMKDIGERLNRAQNAFDSAYSKLGSGRGNLVRSAERIRELGVKPAKSLQKPMIEAAMDEE